MAIIRGMILFNGTDNDDKDVSLTNVVKLRDALIQDDEQFVIYRDGIGNDQQWSGLARWVALATGYGGGWVMDEAYSLLKAQIDSRIKSGVLKQGDTLSLSTGGFSRGAAMARHFAREYVLDRLTKNYGNKFKIELDGEYLFDTVGAFGVPINLWLLEKIGVLNQEIDLGWDFKVPKATKAYHAVSLDEKREAFTHKPLNKSLKPDAQEHQEVFFSGDHSSVGGGHTKPDGVDKLCDRHPLHYMAKMAQKNGFRLDPGFVNRHSLNDLNKIYALGHPIFTQTDNFPSTQIEDRDIIELVDKVTQKPKAPCIHWSLLERIKQDEHYRPANLSEFAEFDVLHENNEKKQESFKF